MNLEGYEDYMKAVQALNMIFEAFGGSRIVFLNSTKGVYEVLEPLPPPSFMELFI
jgi:hypothetical protein